MKKMGIIFLGVFLILPLINCQNKKAPGTSGDLSSVYFDYDQSLIRSDAATILQGNASYLKGHEGMYTAEGHCDERGSNEYNIALGQRRADSARNYLINLGVNSSNLKTVSYGEEKPVCHEHDETCWWKNRRADFRKR